MRIFSSSQNFVYRADPLSAAKMLAACLLSLTLQPPPLARQLRTSARFDRSAIAAVALVSDAELLTVAPVAPPAAAAERPPSRFGLRALLARCDDAVCHVGGFAPLAWLRAKLRRRPRARVRRCEDGVYKMHAKQGPRTLVFEPTTSDECSLDAIDYM